MVDKKNSNYKLYFTRYSIFTIEINKNYKMRKFLVLSIMLTGLVFSGHAIKINRTIFPNQIKAGGEIIVSVTINKEGIEGFARLIENVPEGFRAEELNSATGNFIFENGKVRIIWLTMPEGDTYKAEYRLVHTGSKTGLIKLDGKFHYVKNDKRLEISLSTFNFTVKNASTPKEIVRLEKSIEKLETADLEVVKKVETADVEVAKKLETVDVEVVKKVETVDIEVVKKVETVDVEVAKKVETVDVEVVKKVETVDVEVVKKVETADVEVVKKVETVDIEVVDKIETVSVEDVNKVEPKEEEKIIDVNSELFFKIQLGAYSSEKSSVVFGNLPEIHFIKVGNVFKYYSGKFTNEADARAVIPQAKAKGFKGAFLVRFKNGKRI